MISMRSQQVALINQKMTAFSVKLQILRKNAFKKLNIGVFCAKWMFLLMDTHLCPVRENS